MPVIGQDLAFERFLKDGRNSSHFVWFLDDFKFFQSSNNWIFGFTRVGDVTLLPLEPLIPGAPVEYDPGHEEQFSAAWKEFCDELDPEICAFTAVYTPFQKLLAKRGFQSVEIGVEPWIDLERCIPRGNSGKGVRSARNQALNAGLKVEEWSSMAIRSDASKRETLADIFRLWKLRNPVCLEGFLDACDPFARMEIRRYFVLKDKADRAQAFLIATPIPGIKSYFLEDLVMRPDAPCGTGELLTLEAMVTLNEEYSTGYKEASLGVVSVTNMAAAESHGLPKSVDRLVRKLPGYLTKLYNYKGLETFRRRFKPERWESVHLAVLNRRPGRISDSGAWLKVLVSILRAFRPRLQLSWNWVRNAALRPLKKHPLSFIVLTASLLLFWRVNGFGELPDWALDKFGFTGAAPFWQWSYRSVVSDQLYFSLAHFLLCVPLYLVLVWQAEKKHPLRFLLPLFALVTLFSDSIAQVFILKPFYFLSFPLYLKLIDFKDVGGSIIMMTFAGLALSGLTRNKEIVFSLAFLGVAFFLVFTNPHLHTLVLNLNHLLFLVIGFITGKARQEVYRRASQKAAKGRPPVARCVAQPALRLSKAVKPAPAEAEAGEGVLVLSGGSNAGGKGPGEAGSRGARLI